MSYFGLLTKTAPGVIPAPEPVPAELLEGFTAHMVGHNASVRNLGGTTTDSEIVLVAETYDPVVTLPYIPGETWTGHASIVMPDGTAHPLTVGGSRELSISTATDADPLDGLKIPMRGAFFRVWSAGRVPGPSAWTGRSKRVGAGDLTTGGLIPEDRNRRDDPTVPYAIRGRSTYGGPQVLIVGDSITTICTSLFTYSDAYGTFWSKPLMEAGIPAIMTGVWGQSHADVIDADSLSEEGHRRFDAVLNAGHLTHALTEYGVNDIFGRGSAPWVRANALWSHLATSGLERWQTTTTAYSPTGLAHERTPIRNEWNDGIRAGHPALTGYIEMADVVESARDSGVWRDGTKYTADGIHPNNAGLVLMREPIAAWAASIKA